MPFGHSMNSDGRARIALSHPSGTPLVPMEGLNLRAGATGTLAFNYPSWSAPDETPVVLIVGGSDNQYYINFAIDISFAEISGLERQPVLPFLQQCSDMVEGIVLAFEAKFFV